MHPSWTNPVPQLHPSLISLRISSMGYFPSPATIRRPRGARGFSARPVTLTFVINLLLRRDQLADLVSVDDPMCLRLRTTATPTPVAPTVHDDKGNATRSSSALPNRAPPLPTPLLSDLYEWDGSRGFRVRTFASYPHLHFLPIHYHRLAHYQATILHKPYAPRLAADLSPLPFLFRSPY